MMTGYLAVLWLMVRQRFHLAFRFELVRPFSLLLWRLLQQPLPFYHLLAMTLAQLAYPRFQVELHSGLVRLFSP